MVKRTQHQKIIAAMCNEPAKKWWLAADFQRPELGDNLVGYEATARMSELSKLYPGLIGTEREGRFRKIRLIFENIGVHYNKWPWEVRKILIDYNLMPSTARNNLELF